MIHGHITPPGDKSLSHRAFMFGALAQGQTSVSGALESADVASTRAAMAALGARIEQTASGWLIEGGELHEPLDVIDAGNSGTTTRLLCGILATIDGTACITGDASLRKRPMGRVIEPLSQMGAQFLARGKGLLPLAVRGGQLKAIEYNLKTASAQVKSAVLLAGLRAEGRTTVTEPGLSRDHTERLLSHFGAAIERQGLTVSLKGGQTLFGQELHIPGDPSSAAFPAVLAAACSGSEVQINHICLNPTRIGFIAPLKRMGAEIDFINVREEAGDTVGDIVVKGKGLKGTRIAGDEIPWLIDELPVLIAAAALAEGRTEIRDARELRVKESDRIAAMANGIRALGGEVSELEDGIIIEGPLRLHDGAIETHDDHRIAMSFYVLGRAAGINVAIDKPDCVVISYPNFFSDMEGLK